MTIAYKNICQRGPSMIERLKERLKNEEIKSKFIGSLKPELKSEALTTNSCQR